MTFGNNLPVSVDYFDWLCRIIHGDKNGDFYDYQKLLLRLYQTTYYPANEYDKSRSKDGKLLRFYYKSYGDSFIDDRNTDITGHRFDDTFYEESQEIDCSILEMLIALAIKIDEVQLYSMHSDRSFIWFWIFIETMGLAINTDYVFDDHAENNDVDQILRLFTINAYNGANPAVCLFPIRDPYYDYTDKPIWDQMNKWIYEQYDELDSIDPSKFIENYKWRNES